MIIELQLLIMMEVFWLILKLEIQRRWKITKTEKGSQGGFFQDGFGTKVRNSSTIKGSMMYAAYCSPTQHKVIRISIHHDVITDLMKMMVPSIAISLFAGIISCRCAD